MALGRFNREKTRQSVQWLSGKHRWLTETRVVEILSDCLCKHWQKKWSLEVERIVEDVRKRLWKNVSGLPFA